MSTQPHNAVESVAPSRAMSRLVPAATPENAEEGTYLHPGAKTLFEKCPMAKKIPVFGKSCEGYGPKCTVALSTVYFLNKGLGNNLVSVAMYAMFRDVFGIDSTRYQRLSGISDMGWSIKAFYAMVSDSMAIFGYTKRWYCAGACVVGAAFTLGFALLPGKTSSADMAAGFVFLANLCMANVDILSEGHYSRLMRRHPRCGPALVSWIWWFILAASIVASVIQGPLSDIGRPQVGIYISAAAQVVCVIFFILNWYGEEPNRVERTRDIRAEYDEVRRLRAAKADADDSTSVVPEKNLHPEMDGAQEPGALRDDLVQGEELVCVDGEEEDEMMYPEPEILTLCCGMLEINVEVCRRNWKIFVFSGVMVCAVVTLAVVTILGDSWDLLYTSIAVCVVSIAGSFVALPLVIAKANTYFFLHMVLYLNYPGVMDSFYMAKPACLPDGPHFTYFFYKTIGGVIGNVAGIAGVTAFSYIFSKMQYRVTLIVTILVQIIASVFDIVLVERWNLYIGIPDHAMYILGDAIVYKVCYYLAWMPMVLLLSRVCPRGSESLIYALVAGNGNLGSSMASTIGSLLNELAWPTTATATYCDFGNLPLLLVVGHFCLPLLIIPISFLLIPNARVCDDLDVDGHVVKKQAKKEMEHSSDSENEPYKDSAAMGERMQSTPSEERRE